MDPCHVKLKKKLQKFTKRFGLREDWHEPDERGVSARIIGHRLDNAFGEDSLGDELIVVLLVDGKEQFRINLASLLALACEDPRSVC